VVGNAVAGSLALTVHGPAGVVDLMVPGEAMAVDVAAEYAAQCRLAAPPPLHLRSGAPLPLDRSIAEAGVTSGAVLVAAGGIRPGPLGRAAQQRAGTDVLAGPVVVFAVAVLLAGLASWLAAHVGGRQHDVVIGLLAFSALVGVLPVGRFRAARAAAAPAFGAAAAFAVQWSPVPERLPTIIGAAALVAALTAAVARALDEESDAVQRVWIIGGIAVFLLSGGVALAGWAPQVVWALLLAAAMLAARLVPGLAVDVPDQYLLDLERLAVTAWSARERPTGKRGRTVVPVDAVAAVAARGTRVVTAAGAAVWVACAIAAPLLLATATLPIDRTGARVMVFLAGAAILLAARSYRHLVARALLRAAGLTCWVALLVVLLGPETSTWRGALPTIVVLLLGTVLVLVAVATGRGWRSAWWARRAEIAEGLAGSGALAATVVAVGLFRALWELKFRV
jgi:hypothetical protein